ncbi:hypothetical protein L6452_28168 [Arctium lappa]|uniref:Uncharacterized protein n=1 Tax=Arctium lappa TaxID=4217 RepID=A0ACB9A213_ARCLA|nr:hypothetical protein L6452_28168 [Arctium lappa]
MDTSLQQDEVHVNARYHNILCQKSTMCWRNLQALKIKKSLVAEDIFGLLKTERCLRPKTSSAEEVFSRRGLRLLKTEIGTILANGVDQVGILGFRLRSLSSIRLKDVLLLCLLRLIFDFTEHLYRNQAAKRTSKYSKYDDIKWKIGRSSSNLQMTQQ